MPYPLSPRKYAEPSVTKPSLLYDEDDSFPTSAVLCFQPPVYEYAQRTYEGDSIDPGHPRYSLYSLSHTNGKVGAIGNLVIGGPATARVIEELIARGTNYFVIVGHAGGIQRDIEVGDVVVVERALRDEGTSYHYLEPERTVDASRSLTMALADTARSNGETIHLGTTWTMDAIFRETVPEIEQYADDGVLTTDMEAASAFAVAKYRDVAAGAAFIVSDYVGLDEWEGHLDDTWSHLERLFDCAVATLTDDT